MVRYIDRLAFQWPTPVNWCRTNPASLLASFYTQTLDVPESVFYVRTTQLISLMISPLT